MMELEERIVYSELVTFEPFEKVTDDGQPVDDRRSHGGVGGGGGGYITRWCSILSNIDHNYSTGC